MNDDNARKVSVVILMYRSADYIARCLSSIAAAAGSDALEIVVADNASGDRSLRVAKSEIERLGMSNARLLPLMSNLGCAGGNNAAWHECHGEVVVFLNPDTEVTPDFFRELTTPIFDDETVAVTGAKIYYPGTRTLQHAGGFVHPNGMTGHFGAGETDDAGKYDEVRECDYVTGAGFAVRRAVLEKLNGFDEEYYPAYFEETDFCARVRRLLKMKVLFIPTAVLYHHESVTLQAESPMFRRLYQKMRVIYLWKNLRTPAQWKRAAGFEKWWMLHSPHSRGHRREQFRAYIEGTLQLLRNRLIGRRRR